jgi:hypothetical protein
MIGSIGAPVIIDGGEYSVLDVGSILSTEPPDLRHVAVRDRVPPHELDRPRVHHGIDARAVARGVHAGT